MLSRSRLVALAVLILGGLVVAQPKPDLPVIQPANAKLARTLEGMSSPATGLAQIEGKGVVVGTENGSLFLWLREEDKAFLADAKPREIKGHAVPVTAVAAAGSLVASASVDGQILLWNQPADKPLHTLRAGSPVRALAIAPDGKNVASAGDDNAVTLWDAASGKPLRKLTGPTDWLLAVAFSPDGKVVAAGGQDGKLWAWEAASGKKLYDVAIVMPGVKDPPPVVIQALAFAPDGKKIAVGGSDARIHEVDAASGKYIRAQQGHTAGVTSVTYHAGGNLLVSSSKDRTVRLWNGTSGGMYKNLEGHTAWAEGVTLAEKGTLAVSTSADRTVRVWDLGAVPMKPATKPKK
ncbi:MAG: WD40 repeat domain-containing protein [Gemmataceae bacterium]